MPVADPNEMLARMNRVDPSEGVRTTCMTCGADIPEGDGPRHVCNEALKPRRRRRRVAAAKRYARMKEKQGKPVDVPIRCELCGDMRDPEQPHACRPGPMPPVINYGPPPGDPFGVEGFMNRYTNPEQP